MNIEERCYRLEINVILWKMCGTVQKTGMIKSQNWWRNKWKKTID